MELAEVTSKLFNLSTPQLLPPLPVYAHVVNLEECAVAELAYECRLGEPDAVCASPFVPAYAACALVGEYVAC